MKVLVTGARGKVGRAAVPVLEAAGHEVVATDLGPVSWDVPPGATPYVRADLTDAGEVHALVGGVVGAGNTPGAPVEAVVHAAAIPAPGSHAPHVVFGNNALATFNVVESCVRLGVARLVYLSSETVPGFAFAERPFLPDYLPVDEDHPVRPQDPYALSKHLGEQLCDAAARRSDLRCLSLRPTWVQDAASYPVNLGPLVGADPGPSVNGYSYIDAEDLADAIRLAVESDLPGHEVVYISSPDTIGGVDLHAQVRRHFGDAVELRPVDRPDAAGTSTAKARRLLGWVPTRSWRDHLGPDGSPLRRAEVTPL